MTSFLLLSAWTLILAAPVQELRSSDLTADVARLAAAATNEERFEALTALLRARNLTFTTEPVTIDKALGREPRSSGRNIIVTLGQGTDTILVGAHYDAARLSDGSLSKGAVDNAASSVILVRLAEMLRTQTLTTRVRFVWFDMEELGLIGSAQYVAAHANERLLAMINFDINAYGDTVLFGPSTRQDNAALRRALRQTCVEQDLQCVGFAQMPPGDDRSFVKAGVPTVSVAILPEVEVHQLWLIMNGGAGSGLAQGVAPAIMKTIHTPEDTPDKVNGDVMARMIRFAAGLVRAAAQR